MCKSGNSGTKLNPISQTTRSLPLWLMWFYEATDYTH